MNDKPASPPHLDQLHRQGLRLGAVILAGGLARRMNGEDKGLIPIAGKTMVAHVLQTVQPQVDVVVINANRNKDLYGAYDVPVVADAHEGHLGPLAGLCAGLATLDTELVFMCPCDSPFVDAELISRLAIACSETDVDVAVAADAERLQPVFCIVRQRVHKSLDAFLASGERKIDRWYATQQMQTVNCADLEHSFRNINTEDERRAAEVHLMAQA
ncbi:MAG: molybdenum cofactor guanylyltransferase MobA [Granulosicoccus sp.]